MQWIVFSMPVILYLKLLLSIILCNFSCSECPQKRWRVKECKRLFERIVWQCVEAGLIDGSKLFVDASLIDADASNNSVVDTHRLKKYLNKGYRQLERRLDDGEKTSPATSRYISTTDPDASPTRHGGGKALSMMVMYS